MKNKKRVKELKNKMKKNYSFFKTDGFSLLLIVFALVTALMIPYIIVDDKHSLNTGWLMYIAIATIISSILDPILTLFGLEKNRVKQLGVSLGVISSAVLFMSNLYNQEIINWVESFSSRGGFTAISITLLILKLAEINYDLKIDEESINNKKIKEEQIKELEELKELREDIDKIKKELNKSKIIIQTMLIVNFQKNK